MGNWIGKCDLSYVTRGLMGSRAFKFPRTADEMSISPTQGMEGAGNALAQDPAAGSSINPRGIAGDNVAEMALPTDGSAIVDSPDVKTSSTMTSPNENFPIVVVTPPSETQAFMRETEMPSNVAVSPVDTGAHGASTIDEAVAHFHEAVGTAHPEAEDIPDSGLEDEPTAAEILASTAAEPTATDMTEVNADLKKTSERDGEALEPLASSTGNPVRSTSSRVIGNVDAVGGAPVQRMEEDARSVAEELSFRRHSPLIKKASSQKDAAELGHGDGIEGASLDEIDLN